MSTAESRPTPDHKIQLSHAAGVVQPVGSKTKRGPNTTIASQTECLLAAERPLQPSGPVGSCLTVTKVEPIRRQLMAHRAPGAEAAAKLWFFAGHEHQPPR